MNAVILDHNIDTSFITQLEQRNPSYRFLRIDADLTESMVEETSEDELKDTEEKLSEIFKKALSKDKLTVKVEKFKNKDISSVITLSEEGRRMQDMMRMYSMGGMGGMDPDLFGGDETLTLNANNELVQYILEHPDSEHEEDFCRQLYDLASLANSGREIHASATTALINPPASTPATAMANTMPGNARKISEMRISTVSIRCSAI